MAPMRHDGFISRLGFTFDELGDRRVGTVALVPELCAPGTDRPRAGVLATLADLVAGHPPERPTAATSDLSLHVWRVPSSRLVQLEARTLKAGRRLIVTESTFTTADDPEPFACSLATFVAMPEDAPPRPHPLPKVNTPRLDADLAERIGAQVLAPGVVELHRSPFITNGLEGTIQGGLIALVAELAAESYVADAIVRDLDVRYLNAVRVGPALTTTTLVGRNADDVTLRISIDEPERPVAHALVVCRSSHSKRGA